MQPDRDHRPSLPLEDRFVQGIVLSIDKNVLHLKLPENSARATHARVREGTFPPGVRIADFGDGSKLDVFLETPADQYGLWHASLALGNRETNPWLHDRPEPGLLVEGEAIRYVEEFGVVIQLDNGIEALLHRNQIPCGSFNAITHSIHLGDRIAALIERIDTPHLDIRLSVNLLLERLAKKKATQLKSEIEENRTGGCPTPVSVSAFSGQAILIVDDNKEFAEALKVWLESLGGKVVSARNAHYVEQILRQASPRFALLDYNLESVEQRREIHGLLRRKHLACKVALMSGDHVNAAQYAEQMGWTFLPKPLEYSRLRAWLEGTAIPPMVLPGGEVNPLWGHNTEERDVLAEAERHLQTLCQKTGCLAALWVQQQRPGAYAALAWHGLRGEEVRRQEPHFAQSLVGGVMTVGEGKILEVADAGPVKQFAPDMSKFVMGIPLDYGGATHNALVIFRTVSFDSATEERIKELGERLPDFAERMVLIEHAREVESFAVLGRAQTGLLHDVRGALDPLVRTAEALEETLKRGTSVEEIREEIRLLGTQAKRAADLARADLRAIQKVRREQIQLVPALRQIVKLMRFSAEKDETSIHLKIGIPDLVVSLPPHVLEQPLINLIDNALFHCKGRPWAAVTVETELKPEDNCPISIRVRDDGRGMDSDVVQNLFCPRISSKGEKGVGLGLYVSRNLLRSIGGELELEKTVRWLGSSFVIRLPLILKEN